MGRKTAAVERHDDAADLARLADLWDELERLVRKCKVKRAIGEKDEHTFAALMKEAQLLVGRVSGHIHRPMVQLYGATWDALTTLLGTESISSMFSAIPTVEYWFMSLSGVRSETIQALGRVEADRQKSRVSAEAIERWQWLIVFLERMRRWAVSRPRLLERGLNRIEGSRAYRIAAVVSTFGSFVVFAVALVGIAGVIVGILL